VSDRETILTGLVDIRIQNPFTTREMDAVRITVEVNAHIRINIRRDYKISGEVHDLKTDIKEFKTFF